MSLMNTTLFPNAPSISLFFFISLIVFCFVNVIIVQAGNFHRDVDITWGDGRGKIANDGQLLTLELDRSSGSGFQSKQQYLFGNFSVQLKLVGGDSASTITSFFLKSEGPSWDQISFEFFGNLEGDPCILHTNIYVQGQAVKEQNYYLWFDPAGDFHTYTILWNPIGIIFYVDDKALRTFKPQRMRNLEVPYPMSQAMRVYGTISNASHSTVREFGLVPIDWRRAPFVAFFRNFNSDDCVWSDGASSCTPNRSAWYNFKLSRRESHDMVKAQTSYMLYSVCDTYYF